MLSKSRWRAARLGNAGLGTVRRGKEIVSGSSMVLSGAANRGKEAQCIAGRSGVMRGDDRLGKDIFEETVRWARLCCVMQSRVGSGSAT